MIVRVAVLAELKSAEEIAVLVRTVTALKQEVGQLERFSVAEMGVDKTADAAVMMSWLVGAAEEVAVESSVVALLVVAAVERFDTARLKEEEFVNADAGSAVVEAMIEQIAVLNFAEEIDTVEIQVVFAEQGEYQAQCVSVPEFPLLE